MGSSVCSFCQQIRSFRTLRDIDIQIVVFFLTPAQILFNKRPSLSSYLCLRTANELIHLKEIQLVRNIAFAFINYVFCLFFLFLIFT